MKAIAFNEKVGTREKTPSLDVTGVGIDDFIVTAIGISGPGNGISTPPLRPVNMMIFPRHGTLR